MRMNKEKRTRIYLFFHIVLVAMSFCSLVLGLGLANLNYEKTAFMCADTFATRNVSTNSTLIFEYESKDPITDENTITNYNNFLNDYSGTRKYFPLGSGWTQSEATTIQSSILDKNIDGITFSDLTYLTNDGVEYSSNLLELNYPNKYDEAFFESPNNIYINGDELEIKTNVSYSLTIRQGTNSLTNSEVEWLSNDGNVASIDENGTINAKSPGETTIIAKYNNLVDEIKVIVNNQLDNDYKLVNFTPCIVPIRLAVEFGNGEPKSAINKTFTCNFGYQDAIFKIGGYYDNVATRSPYRNSLYSNNIGEQIYILRNNNYYHYPIKKVYFTITPQQEINMSMFSDINYLKSISNLSFNIPSEMPINNAVLSNENPTTIYEYIMYVSNNNTKIVGWAMFCFFIALFILDFIWLRKKIKSSYFYVTSYVIGVILIPVILYLIDPVIISNKIYFIMNSITGWTIISIGIVYSIIIAYIFIKKNNKKNENIISTKDINL